MILKEGLSREIVRRTHRIGKVQLRKPLLDMPGIVSDGLQLCRGYYRRLLHGPGFRSAAPAP